MSEEIDLKFLPMDVTSRFMAEQRNPDSVRGLCPESMKCNFLNLQISDGVLSPSSQYTAMICHDSYRACPRYNELNPQRTE